MRAAVQAHLEFTAAVQEHLEGGENVVWSPFSVASALALVARGAGGVTRDELLTLLLGDKSANVEDLVGLLGRAEDVGVAQHTGAQQPEISVANTLWADKRVQPKRDFVKAVKAMPSGAVRSAPFADDPEAAREMINRDVARTTHDLIRELLKPGVIQPDTVATLVNALYLKVAWRTKFVEEATEPQDFHAPTGTRKVPTMAVRGKADSFGYGRIPGWQAVRIRTAGKVDAYVLLPDAELPPVNAATLAALLESTDKAPVNLYLPKLELRLQAQLRQVLDRLGAGTMFTDDADLTGISDDPPLAVQAVIHETVLKVDEQGFEGAAATAITMRSLSVMRPPENPVEVRVDRPFLFVVTHQDTGIVYFSAKVVDP
ncbi:serpin family protein [Kibdelosporangium lantanae]